MPLVYDLYCGLGGWSEAFLAEGYDCIGFDVEAHDYGTGGYPGKLMLRDVRSIHGSELKDASVIVASPPCQEPSYRAMPWKRAKGLNSIGPPHEFIDLFNQCFRIQREAIAASGRFIPLVVENVRGAQRWVGRARWHHGSYYLWGDIPALMPVLMTRKLKTTGPTTLSQAENHNCHISEMRDSFKVPGFRFDGSGRSFQTASVEGVKFSQSGDAWFDGKPRDKMLGHNGPAAYGSKSSKRKAASAMIAKIPFPLAQHIARTYYPR